MITFNEFVKDESLNTTVKTPSYMEYTKTPSYAEEQLEHAKKKEDIVNHPKHYTQGEIECIEVIEYINKKLDMDGFEGFCLGNFIKYIWRCNDKNGWEDIDKAIFYMDKFLQEQFKDD